MIFQVIHGGDACLTWDRLETRKKVMKSKMGWILFVITALFVAFFIWHFSFIAGASMQD